VKSVAERKCIFAYTPPGFYPPYLSINLEEHGVVSVSVRGPKKAETETTQPHASIEITDKEQLVHLFASIGEFLYGDEVMAITGKVIFQLLTSTPPESIAAAADNAVAIAEDLSEQN
jgi:hypothetical protein